MKQVRRLLSILLFGSAVVSLQTAFSAGAGAAMVPGKQKNWLPPAAQHLYVQTLTEEIMPKHPELISITFHGVPPGAVAKTYTMFGGSLVDRIGNPDDPDDIMIIETGITILDPRWHRTHDAVRKFVVMLPLRDASGENIGLLVLAYRNLADSHKTDRDFFDSGTALRDEIARKIPTFATLFESAH